MGIVFDECSGRFVKTTTPENINKIHDLVMSVMIYSVVGISGEWLDNILNVKNCSQVQRSCPQQ